MSLIVLCAAGLAFALISYYRATSATVLPEDSTQFAQAINTLKATGVVRRFNPRERLLIVNPDKWNALSKTEKMGIVTRIARQCADESEDRTWGLTVEDAESRSIVAEIGAEGLSVQ